MLFSRTESRWYESHIQNNGFILLSTIDFECQESISIRTEYGIFLYINWLCEVSLFTQAICIFFFFFAPQGSQIQSVFTKLT